MYQPFSLYWFSYPKMANIYIHFISAKQITYFFSKNPESNPDSQLHKKYEWKRKLIIKKGTLRKFFFHPHTWRSAAGEDVRIWRRKTLWKKWKRHERVVAVGAVNGLVACGMTHADISDDLPLIGVEKCSAMITKIHQNHLRKKVQVDEKFVEVSGQDDKWGNYLIILAHLIYWPGHCHMAYQLGPDTFAVVHLKKKSHLLFFFLNRATVCFITLSEILWGLKITN